MIDQRLSCGVVVSRETGDGWLTLMLRAYRNWDFPKGMRSHQIRLEGGDCSTDSFCYPSV